MVKLILFIAFLIACMIYIWFKEVDLAWKVLVNVWCALIIWLSIEMKTSPIMNDDGEPVKKTEDKEGIEWGEVRP